MQNIWRLIDTGPLSGPENMAIDEALLACFDPETSAPGLRIYGWSPPALSLGRFQDAGAILDLDRCRFDNVPVVRRITGGGVIYHADELTYSIVCAPHHLPHAATVKESFRILTSFLLLFYRDLGLKAEYAVDSYFDSSKFGERTTFCFAGRENFDILINGKKIGGNAQRRLKNAIFQHGSIPLHDRVERGINYLRESPSGIDSAVTSLMQNGIAVDSESLGKRLQVCFAGTFQVPLSPSGLNTFEEEVAAALIAGRYASDAWNLRGEEPWR